MTSLKKIILGIIIALVILFLAGVVLAGLGLQNLEEQATPRKEGQTGEIKSGPILQIGETASSSKLQVTVFSANVVKKYNYYSEIIEDDFDYSAPPGTMLVLVDAEIQNIGDNTVYGGVIQFSLVDSGGNKYDSEMYLGQNDLDLFTEVYANQKIQGKFVFEVPEFSSDLKIQYDFGDFVVGTKLATWEI